jgi:hypothetical protein
MLFFLLPWTHYSIDSRLMSESLYCHRTLVLSRHHPEEETLRKSSFQPRVLFINQYIVEQAPLPAISSRGRLFSMVFAEVSRAGLSAARDLFHLSSKLAKTQECDYPNKNKSKLIRAFYEDQTDLHVS